MSKISPPTSPGVSAATPRRGGASSCLPIRTWRPTPASTDSHQVDQLPWAGRRSEGGQPTLYGWRQTPQSHRVSGLGRLLRLVAPPGACGCRSALRRRARRRVVDDAGGVDPVEGAGREAVVRARPGRAWSRRRAGLTAWKPSEPMPPQRSATVRLGVLLGQERGLGVPDTDGPVERRCAWPPGARAPGRRTAFSAPGLPNGLSWAWANDQCENAPCTSSSDATGLSPACPRRPGRKRPAWRRSCARSGAPGQPVSARAARPAAGRGRPGRWSRREPSWCCRRAPAAASLAPLIALLNQSPMPCSRTAGGALPNTSAVAW